MKFLRKTLVVTTLTWIPVVLWCAILNGSGNPLRWVAEGAWLALPGWPLLFAVLVPMMGVGEFLADARTPAPVAAPARRSSLGK